MHQIKRSTVKGFQDFLDGEEDEMDQTGGGGGTDEGHETDGGDEEGEEYRMKYEV